MPDTALHNIYTFSLGHASQSGRVMKVHNEADSTGVLTTCESDSDIIGKIITQVILNIGYLLAYQLSNFISSNIYNKCISTCSKMSGRATVLAIVFRSCFLSVLTVLEIYVKLDKDVKNLLSIKASFNGSIR